MAGAGAGDEPAYGLFPTRLEAAAPAADAAAAKQPPGKVVQFEAFLNEKLRGDLQRVLEQRDGLFSEIAEYEQLQSTIETIMRTSLKDELKTQVDLGCNIYCQARVEDPSLIMVSIGYGLYLEMPLADAVKFTKKKTAHLRRRCEALTEQAGKIRALIQIVLEGLRELQGLQRPTPREEDRF